MTNNKKAKAMTFYHSRLTSIISIALVLFLLGLILLTGMLGNNLSKFVKENISFSIILKEKISEGEIDRIQRSLKKKPYIKSTEYISKERAARELQEELGDIPEIFADSNPLKASIEVRLKSEYANPDSLQLIEKHINTYTSVSQLLYRKDMLQLVQQNIKEIGFVLFILALILTVISFVLISNTIRLLIYSQRFLIHTMKLVGATAGFIRKPFVRFNLIGGLIASLIAIILLGGTMFYLQQEIGNLPGLFDIKAIITIIVFEITVGMFLSFTATIIAVNKYLRMDVEKLYYI